MLRVFILFAWPGGAMTFQHIDKPVEFMQYLSGELPYGDELAAYQSYWFESGQAVSDAVDRMGTPWLQMFDDVGKRIDTIQFPPEYWKALRSGYKAGSVWRCFDEQSVVPFYRFGYVTCFFDTGIFCPHTVSMSTAVPVFKYAGQAVKDRFMPHLLARDDRVWQGATWMTEVNGGSDLGRGVETIAKVDGDKWLLTGDKYFASNAHADLAVVAARPADAVPGVRGLALFLVPRYREDGQLNFTIRRLKDKVATRSVPTGEVELRDSEAYLLGDMNTGIYLILEVLNVSRVANSIGSVALAQRALADAYQFAQKRIAFDKPVFEHLLLNRQFHERLEGLKRHYLLAWEAVRLLDSVWRETPRYSEPYHLFRLMAHLAKYGTAEFAAQTAKWTMEVYGGVGTLAENRVEKWLREAMVLAIWEGTPHRQILDGLEAMERKNAHRLLFQHFGDYADPQQVEQLSAQIEDVLAMPQPEKEWHAQEIFDELVRFTAKTLQYRQEQG